MKATKLKAVHLVKEGDAFQVIGIYRVINNTARFEQESEIETQVLSTSESYRHERREMVNLAYANQVEYFDLSGVTFDEELARMKKK